MPASPPPTLLVDPRAAATGVLRFLAVPSGVQNRFIAGKGSIDSALANGAGLAAPQIGVLQRVVIFGVAHNPRYPDAEPVPDTVLINPTLWPSSDELEDGWEGCLSVPGMRGLVPRHRRLRYAGFDEQGQRFEREAEGFHARVVQHEVDHLDGILYPRRIRDLRMFGFNEALFPGELLADD